MLCVVIKICLAKAVAQFETHLRVCVILGLRKDLKPIIDCAHAYSLHVGGVKFIVNRKSNFLDWNSGQTQKMNRVRMAMGSSEYASVGDLEGALNSLSKLLYP